jgi:hypothetical protein
MPDEEIRGQQQGLQGSLDILSHSLVELLLNLIPSKFMMVRNPLLLLLVASTSHGVRAVELVAATGAAIVSATSQVETSATAADGDTATFWQSGACARERASATQNSCSHKRGSQTGVRRPAVGVADARRAERAARSLCRGPLLNVGRGPGLGADHGRQHGLHERVGNPHAVGVRGLGADQGC